MDTARGQAQRELAAFIDLVLTDPDFVSDEFEAIITNGWSNTRTPPPSCTSCAVGSHQPRRPHTWSLGHVKEPSCHEWSPVRLGRKRQRSPPEVNRAIYVTCPAAPPSCGAGHTTSALYSVPFSPPQMDTDSECLPTRTRRTEPPRRSHLRRPDHPRRSLRRGGIPRTRPGPHRRHRTGNQHRSPPAATTRARTLNHPRCHDQVRNSAACDPRGVSAASARGMSGRRKSQTAYTYRADVGNWPCTALANVSR